MQTPVKESGVRRYTFSQYMIKPRWISLWHQLDEVLKFAPDSVLEVGPGPGTFKAAAQSFGLDVQTLDQNPALNPDHVGSILNLPFEKKHFDVVCAFQVLEHLPYEDSLKAFAEMVRVARKAVIISVPDRRSVWRYFFHIPLLGSKHLLLNSPFWRPQKHTYDGMHYWEINKIGYAPERIAADFGKHAKLLKQYRVKENSYHRFFIFEINAG